MIPNDRGITFNGQLPNVHVALLEVVPKLALYIKQYREKAASSTPGQAIMSSGHDPSMNADGSHPLEQGPGHVHVMNSIMVGRVIGPGGTQIREIRDKTGARVRVSNDKLPGTQDRAVTIWGTDEQVQQHPNPGPNPNLTPTLMNPNLDEPQPLTPPPNPNL